MKNKALLVGLVLVFIGVGCTDTISRTEWELCTRECGETPDVVCFEPGAYFNLQCQCQNGSRKAVPWHR
jgi:hypothetical protein